ncbi:hypothetical protein AB205_0026040 [Aquarana catesbeiana]|uniref:Uncharacterized protein n=1 Tax=Aquarana catesbeiana TaxID=8400 RepID=A0A2G9Q175_AQUCT|nr:hypothetical protein AB205_0026040 [Aquarana catesbeiana]
MFHIPISAIKYLCAMYTYFFNIGEKRFGGHHSSEETMDPHLRKKGKSPKPYQRRRRETLWKMSPQQVIMMLWKRDVTSPVKVLRSSSGR